MFYYYFFLTKAIQLGVVVHAFNPSTQGSRSLVSWRPSWSTQPVPGQTELQETLLPMPTAMPTAIPKQNRRQLRYLYAIVTFNK